MSKDILKKNIVGWIWILYLKVHYNPIVTNIIWYWHKNDTSVNGTEQRTQNYNHVYIVIYGKGGKYKLQQKNSFFNKLLGKLGMYMQNNESECLSYTIQKINMKWIKGLGGIPDTIKFLKENIGSKILDINLSNSFLYISTQTRGTKIKKLDCIKIK